MAALSQALKCGIGKNVSQAVNTQCIRSFVVSTNQKSSSGSSKKGNGSSGLSAVPRNIQEINSSIKAKFSPHRARDKTSARTDPKVLQRSGTVSKEFMGSQGSKEGSTKQNTKLNTKSTPKDSHVAVYDGSNSVSLSSVMQSTVPQPYNINGKKAPAHFNMPGGQWAQGEKYVSGDLHAHHSRNIPKKYQAE